MLGGEQELADCLSERSEMLLQVADAGTDAVSESPYPTQPLRALQNPYNFFSGFEISIGVDRIIVEPQADMF